MTSLTIGILAHVDAGKTSLTERLLFNSGVIPSLGSVDKGNTQTDSMELERQRGITIRSAVVSFMIGSLKINLIDTPGHPDFIAEVERALRILDAVILVISAVEGIQSQTRILMQTLIKLQIPTILFINKVDRAGARNGELITDIQKKLFPHVITMNSVLDIGRKDAEVIDLTNSFEYDTELASVLAENNDVFLQQLIDNPEKINKDLCHKELVKQIHTMQLCPIFFGSAITGTGIPALTQALETYFPPEKPDPDAPLSGVIFKIERGSKNEKIAYIRLYSGTIRTRTTIQFYRVNAKGEKITYTAKITLLKIFENGTTKERETAHTGDIVQVWGLSECLINDYIGDVPQKTIPHFSPPGLEVVIVPESLHDRAKLHHALQNMSEQDPLIQMHQNEKGVLSVRLYGEVQREIIQTLLQDEYGIPVHFEKTQTIYKEKPHGTGTAFADKLDPDNFFEATLGLTVKPGADNSGVTFIPGPGRGSLPVAFLKAVEDTVYKTLQQGLYGWEVTDCIVEVTEVGYWDALSDGGDFRNLTPLLLMEALKKAGTDVYEPIHTFSLDIPETALGKILQTLPEFEAKLTSQPKPNHGFLHLKGLLPVRQTFELERIIPHLTQGEGTFTTEFGGYQKVQGSFPSRPRSDNNPLNREEYLRLTLKRG